MRKADAVLGMPVRARSMLWRETIPGSSSWSSGAVREPRRVWESRPVHGEPLEGVLVGLRHLQNGVIRAVMESDGFISYPVDTSWECTEVVHAALVATNLYTKPVLCALADVELLEGEAQ